MKLSCYRSVIEHRKRILVDLRKTPSLNNYIVNAVEQAYPDGRDLAIEEGKKASFGVWILNDLEYPIACPFTIEQILAPDFFG